MSPDGKAVYGIPQDTGPMALLYNKKIFDQYGLTVPTTWDEFAQQAEKLAQASGGKVKMGNFFPTHAPWFIEHGVGEWRRIVQNSKETRGFNR